MIMQKPEHSEEEEPESRQQASPEEQQQIESTQTESGEVGADQESAAPRKRRKKAQLTEAELSQQSHKSIWPILLALAVAVLIAGSIIDPIGLGIGLVFVIVSIIGWGLERQ